MFATQLHGTAWVSGLCGILPFQEGAVAVEQKPPLKRSLLLASSFDTDVCQYYVDVEIVGNGLRDNKTTWNKWQYQVRTQKPADQWTTHS